MERPTAVTVFGILNIIFGVLWVFGTFGVLWVFNTLVPLMTSRTPYNAMTSILEDLSPYRTVATALIPVGFLVAVLLIVAGIGLLRLRPWARALSIGYAVCAIIAAVLGAVVHVLVIGRMMGEVVASVADSPASDVIVVTGSVVAVMSAAVGLIVLVYAVLLLIFMFRPTVVHAFKGTAQPAPM